MTQSREATLDDAASISDAHDGELASLVRRWMTAGRQERLRRDGVPRVAPRADEVAPDLGFAPVAPGTTVEPTEPALEREPDEADPIEAEVEGQRAGTTGDATIDPSADPSADLTGQLTEESGVDTADAQVAGPTLDPPAGPALQAPAPRTPPLPHRPTAEETEHARRIAVLIDARRVDDDVAAGLLARIGERGTVNVCRAYADWSRSDLGAWVGRMRRQGLHSFHQFADDDEQALVAMAIDAVDIARDAAIDEIVIVGDMTSMLPLVHRLHAAGVRVVVVGPGNTPHDVRGACDEFIDTALVGTHEVAPVGRHRA